MKFGRQLYRGESAAPDHPEFARYERTYDRFYDRLQKYGEPLPDWIKGESLDQYEQRLTALLKKAKATPRLQRRSMAEAILLNGLSIMKEIVLSNPAEYLPGYIEDLRREIKDLDAKIALRDKVIPKLEELARRYASKQP
jgi:hypothetical protein